MERAIFSIGSNCGNREANVQEAILWLSEMLSECKISHIYATPDAHGGARQYINAVVAGECLLTREDMEIACKRHEEECGRTPEARAVGDVPIDIDIVIWGNVIQREKDFKADFFQLGFRRIQLG